MIIDKSEFEDFKAVLAEHGFPEEDFELSPRKDPLPVDAISPEIGNVTVRRKRTGAEQTYRSGHLTAWVVEFEKDLAAGRFS